MICFHASMRFLIVGTASMMWPVASRAWANKSGLPLWRIEKPLRTREADIPSHGWVAKFDGAPLRRWSAARVAVMGRVSRLKSRQVAWRRSLPSRH
jgi:hypothetical protein